LDNREFHLRAPLSARITLRPPHIYRTHQLRRNPAAPPTPQLPPSTKHGERRRTCTPWHSPPRTALNAGRPRPDSRSTPAAIAPNDTLGPEQGLSHPLAAQVSDSATHTPPRRASELHDLSEQTTDSPPPRHGARARPHGAPRQWGHRWIYRRRTPPEQYAAAAAFTARPRRYAQRTKNQPNIYTTTKPAERPQSLSHSSVTTLVATATTGGSSSQRATRASSAPKETVPALCRGPTASRVDHEARGRGRYAGEPPAIEGRDLRA
jgi:hypothetical protein